MSAEKRKSQVLPLVLSLIALIIGVLYFAYAVGYFHDVYDSSGGGNTATSIAGIATVTIIFPHLLCVGVAVLLNAIGAFARSRGCMLASGIMYVVAMAAFPMYFLFTVPSALLAFIAFAVMTSRKKDQATITYVVRSDRDIPNA